MQTLEFLQRKINSADKLLSIVKTMKALAAANMRQYEKAVESLDEYYRTVEMGLGVVLEGISETQSFAYHEDSTGAVIAVIFGSDYGFTGQFNEEILKFALHELNEAGVAPKDRIFFSVGEQVYARLEKMDQQIHELFTVPNSLNGINAMVRLLLLKIEEKRSRMNVGKVQLFYNRPRTGVAYYSHQERLLPVDLKVFKRSKKNWPSRSIPTFTIGREELLAALIRQYIFVSLYRAFGLSLASENASRLASMQAAGKNIEELLENIKAEFRQNRQASITEEIMDIASGFTALNPE